MSFEEQAAQCRRDVESSLKVVDALTANPSCSPEFLLQRMNGVLQAAACGDTAGKLSAISSLFESLGRMQPGTLSDTYDLQFFYFARNFAVIFEELARQQQVVSLGRMRCSAADTSASSNTAAPAAQQLVGCEAWRRAKQRENPGKELDFSVEGIKGALTIFGVARCVREEELRALLLPFGSIVEFFFDQKPAYGNCYAIAKLQSNEAAAEAVASLNGRVLGGTAIIVRRAEYWTKTAPLLQQMQQPDCSKDDAAEAADLNEGSEDAADEKMKLLRLEQSDCSKEDAAAAADSEEGGNDAADEKLEQLRVQDDAAAAADLDARSEEAADEKMELLRLAQSDCSVGDAAAPADLPEGIEDAADEGLQQMEQSDCSKEDAAVAADVEVGGNDAADEKPEQSDCIKDDAAAAADYGDGCEEAAAAADGCDSEVDSQDEDNSSFFSVD